MKLPLKLTALIAVLALASCKKESKFCWTCVTKIYASQSTTPSVVENQVCDKSKKEIDEYAKEGTYTTTVSGGTIAQVITCSQQ